MSNRGKVSLGETIEVRDRCLCLHVQRAARLLARRFDDALRPVGLTHGQFSMLNALNRPRPAAMRDVRRLLGMDRTTLTAALKPLARAGFVATTVDPDDARGRLIALRPAGRRVLARALPIWQSAHAALEAQLAAAEPQQLRASLQRLGAEAT